MSLPSCIAVEAGWETSCSSYCASQAHRSAQGDTLPIFPMLHLHANDAPDSLEGLSLSTITSWALLEARACLAASTAGVQTRPDGVADTSRVRYLSRVATQPPGPQNYQEDGFACPSSADQQAADCKKDDGNNCANHSQDQS